MPTLQSDPPKQTIRQFFDGIAVQYDFLNNFLSFKLDENWRKKARDIVLDEEQSSIMDLGVGTGKFVKLFTEAKSWKKVYAVDFSSEMLKCAKRDLPENVRFVSADFHSLPFESESFDLIISSFTLRSVKDMPTFLSGIYRILTAKGKVAFLCLTRPKSVWWKILYYPYLKIYLPLIGGIFSGNKDAYQFLSASILSFQDPTETASMMKETGFLSVDIHSFSLGMATLIVGQKS